MSSKKKEEISILLGLLDDVGDTRSIWKRLVSKLPSLNKYLEPQDCQKIFDKISQSLKISDEKEADSEETLLIADVYLSDFLDNFSVLISSTPKFAKYVDSIPAEEFRVKVCLLPLILSENLQIQSCTNYLILALIKSCSNFENYKLYIAKEPSAHRNAFNAVDKFLKLKKSLPAFKAAPGTVSSPSDFSYHDPLAEEKLENASYGNANEDEIVDPKDIRNTNLVSLLKQEEEIIRNLKATTLIYQCALDENKTEELSETAQRITNLTQDLKNLHEERRKKKKKIYETKKKAYISKKGETEEFQGLSTLREKCIAVCEDIYQTLSLCSAFMDVTSELSSLDSQISSLYELNVAITFCGLIKTGKSSTLNSFVGFDISPNRITPMTAIPIRYVHHEYATEPVMIIPFYTSLNTVVRRIRQIYLDISRGQKEDEVQNFLAKEVLHPHLLKLLNECINDTIKFHRKYIGVEIVRKNCERVHDLFRLSALNIFSSSTELLPSQWSRGLDFLLTVYCKFEALKGSSKDLVTLSLIDTPGIDESGVVSLKLDKMLKDTVANCHAAAIVSTTSNFQAIESFKITSYLKELKENEALEILVLLNKCDLVDDGQKKSTHVNISQAMGIPTSSVKLISALNYLTALTLQNNLDKIFNKEGKFTIPSNEEIVNYLRAYCQTSNLKMDDLKNYEKSNFLEDLTSLIEESKVQQLQQTLMGLAFNKGMYLSIQTTAKKVLELTISSLANIRLFAQNTSSSEKELLSKIQEINGHIETLTSLENKYLNAKQETQNKIRASLSKIRQNILKDVESLKSVSQSNGLISGDFLKSCASKSLWLQILKSEKGVTFDNKADFEKQIHDMSFALNNKCKEHFESQMEHDSQIRTLITDLPSEYMTSLNQVTTAAIQHLSKENPKLYDDISKLVGDLQFKNITETRTALTLPSLEEKKLASVNKGFFRKRVAFLPLFLFDHVAVDHQKVRNHLYEQVENLFSDDYISNILTSITKKLTNFEKIFSENIGKFQKIKNNYQTSLESIKNHSRNQEKKQLLETQAQQLEVGISRMKEFISYQKQTIQLESVFENVSLNN